MNRAVIRSLFISLCALPVALGAYAQDLPGTGDDAGKTVVYRDTWGVPHIYAPTEEAGLYAMGYAQAQDRPEQLLINLKRAMGEASSIFGKDELREDVVVHMFDHYGHAKEDAENNAPQVRKNLQAFAAGINAFYEAHPEDVPEWWGDRKVDEFMVDAFSRLFLYAWSISQAMNDLERAGIDPGTKEVKRGSNQFAVSPGRSATGSPILYVDPHLSWFGVSRFWEFRIHAGGIVGSGFSLPGNPYIGLGHNENVAWAMTTGGPDTADVFELTVKDGDATQYFFDGEWRQMTKKEVNIEVKDEGTHTETIYYSHHGPIVAWKDGKAYAAKTAYSDATGTAEAWYHFNHATDYKGIMKGLDTLTVFPQNVMVADTSGNIYYQRTGRVPVRPEGFNYDYPVNGSTSATEWKGVHPASDLIQVLNPPQGYMQNCNIPPDAMMVDSPFSLENTLPYIFSDRSYGRAGWTNQRGARAVQLLSSDDSVTIEEALSYGTNIHPYGVERWIEVLRRAHDKHGNRYRGDGDYSQSIEQVLAWDGKLHRNSAPALKYAYWREQIEEDWGNEKANAIEGKIDNHMSAVGAPDKPIELDDEEYAGVLASFHNGLQEIKNDWGNLNAKYGDRFRVGRDDKSWPLGGGGPEGLSCLRNVGFESERDDHTRWGRSGQTSTEIISLTKPIQSWTYVPIGQSDRKDSPHYDDQAEELFSPRVMKPTWWQPADLAKHIESREVLPYDGGAAPVGEGQSAMSPEDAIKAIMTNWKDAIIALDLKKATADYSEDYQDAQASGKAEVLEWLEGIVAQGILDNAVISMEDAEAEIDGDEAFYGPVDLSADGGAFTLDIYFEKEGENWRIVSVDVY